MTEQTCSAYSMIVVPLYDTLACNALSYIMNQGERDGFTSFLVCHYYNTYSSSFLTAEIQVVVVGRDNIRTLVEKANEYPGLKYVISIDPTVPEDVATMAKERNIELRTFDQVIVSNIMCCVNNDI